MYAFTGTMTKFYIEMLSKLPCTHDNYKQIINVATDSDE